jgi:tRNA 2-selenouridine synthase
MIPVTDDLDAAARATFADILDVRTPAEFAEDHIPGAVNLPVLSNSERAEIGRIYVQESRFRARREGAALVARNIAAHLEGDLADKPSSWAPLVYCWRGGQRSAAMATVLSQVGWRPTLVVGGYRTWRRRVSARLYDAQMSAPVILLDGYTGCAKTAILARLAAHGVQSLDLEGLAGHRGSIFGAVAGRSQPNQKLFESRLLAALEALDPARPVVVEAESSKIGRIMTPPLLWRAMATAPRIEVTAPAPARSAYLLAAYADIAADTPGLVTAIAALPGRPGKARIAAWTEMARAGDSERLAAELMEFHYDPAYERSRRRDARPLMGSVAMTSLDEAEQARAAAAIAALVRAS